MDPFGSADAQRQSTISIEARPLKKNISQVPAKQISTIKPDTQATPPTKPGPAHAQHESLLFSIPLELRLMIYEQAFALALDEPLERSTCYPIAPILRACRLIQQEGLKTWDQCIDRATHESQQRRNKAYVASIPRLSLEGLGAGHESEEDREDDEDREGQIGNKRQMSTIHEMSVRLMRLYCYEACHEDWKPDLMAELKMMSRMHRARSEHRLLSVDICERIQKSYRSPDRTASGLSASWLPPPYSNLMSTIPAPCTCATRLQAFGGGTFLR